MIALLSLKVKRNGRVDTSWGDKTPMGLGATVRRVVNESDPATVGGMLAAAKRALALITDRYPVVQGESQDAHEDRQTRANLRAAIEKAEEE